MRYLVSFVALLFAGCLSGLAYGNDAPVAYVPEAPMALVEAPAAVPVCDGNPCTCKPGDCNCPNCPEHKGLVASGLAEMIAAAAIGQCGPAPAGFRWVNNGRGCQLVPATSAFTPFTTFATDTRPLTVALSNAPAALTAGSICPMCGMVMTAQQAATANANRYQGTAPVTYAAPMTTTYTTTYGDPVMDGSGSCGTAGAFMDAGPVRRAFRGFFGRRRAAGGGGCGG